MVGRKLCFLKMEALVYIEIFYTASFFAALPSPGFYPEISGFFEAVGIFWGFLFLKVNLGLFWGFFEKGKFEI